VASGSSAMSIAVIGLCCAIAAPEDPSNNAREMLIVIAFANLFIQFISFRITPNPFVSTQIALTFQT